ncbi:MAG: hypothetical protein ACLFTK_15055 [Anaerolineales bacterium]
MSITLDTARLDALHEAADSLRQAWARQMAERLVVHIAEAWSSSTPAAPGDPPAIDTGALAASIRLEPTPQGYRVGTPLIYGAWLEFGTREMAARPWLRPALEAVRAEARSLVTWPSFEMRLASLEEPHDAAA